ncbi:hypothetical protein MKY64_30445 [Paenibacillus sp. FSL R7-0210]|uniref:hypothetical protein n=1 Tax=Paenibacillus sp. FSL R7-0210 TaxID=2921676 RepID=UPI0030FC0A61
MQTVVLNDFGEKVEIIVNGGVIEIDSTGCAKIKSSSGERYENLIEPSLQSGYASCLTYQPSKADLLNQYLMILFESNRCGHRVDTEIDAALAAYRTEVGI